MLTTDDIYCLRRNLERHEGFRASAYQDSEGWWTIGYGTCIDARRNCGVTKDTAQFIADDTMYERDAQLGKLTWYSNLSGPRKHAILEMAYQLGVNGLLNFKRMIAAIERGDWPTAADEALDSKVAKKQAPERWKVLADMLRTEKYP